MEVASRYLPAQAGVGGDWFDVIPLSGARVALVVGDVVGHGLHAAATMGRLRTAVHTLADLDLPPDELLTHLDDLVGRPSTRATELGARRTPAGRRDHRRDLPVRRLRPGRPGAAPSPAPGTRCRAVVCPTAPWTSSTCRRDRRSAWAGMPFETAELELPEGSLLALYTDGLIEDRRPRHRRRPRPAAHACWPAPDRAPEETCDAVLDALLPARPTDDVALLVARTRRWTPTRSPPGTLPGDPAVVSRARSGGHRPAGRLGPGRAGLHHRAGRQRTGHQRHPARRRARSSCG